MSELDFKFPRKLNVKIWESYVGRQLTYEERFLIEMCKSEKHMNKMMTNLYKHLSEKPKKYYVPQLTNLDGNCLFEALNYYKIGSSVEELRTMLSMIFYIFKDYKNFLPGMETTLEELFSFTNEVGYVSTKDKSSGEPKYYKYSYTIMCQDLGNLSCWSRLPTQLILLVVSYLFKVEIIIIHSTNGHETSINAYESAIDIPNISQIYLGLLGESHYVVLDINLDDDPVPPIFYDEAKRNLAKLGAFLENIKTRQYHEQKKEKEKAPVALESSMTNNDSSNFQEINIDECNDEVTF
ncbi:MAG: hypothetical protein MUO21_01955 [Nitrososphaeraceae archaeon]|nr:hypothetical protein [Nitrososphaeraceae archaeon]